MTDKSTKAGKVGLWSTQEMDSFQTAANISYPTRCVDADTLNSEAFSIFDSDASIQSLPVVKNSKILGMINREKFMGKMAGRFHWEVFSKKHCATMMDPCPLVVEADVEIRDVAKKLLGENASGALAESFIVTRQGLYLGTGFSSDVLAILLQFEKNGAEELRQHRDHLSELVTERTHDLNLAKQTAERANHAKSEFLSNMSHELRTPLHAILAFSRFGNLKFPDGPREKLGQYFLQINESAERLSKLVNDLLDLAKLDSGKMHLNMSASDLCSLTRRSLEELDGLANQRGVRLCFDPEVVSAPIYCDQERVHQVLVNILGNAIKFAPDFSEISINLRVNRGSEVDSQLDGCILQVTDRGPGIPESELDAIFDRFSQSSKTKTGAGGTGLGLPISREIMRLHHGGVTASNVEHGGACFTIKFPSPTVFEPGN